MAPSPKVYKWHMRPKKSLQHLCSQGLSFTLWTLTARESFPIYYFNRKRSSLYKQFRGQCRSEENCWLREWVKTQGPFLMLFFMRENQRRQGLKLMLCNQKPLTCYITIKPVHSLLLKNYLFSSYLSG